jgi:hypothetical protein
MVVAPVAAGREAGLRQLLDSMNAQPGMADPDNPVVPFGRLEGVHYARLVVLNDPTAGDMEVYQLPPPTLPTYLAFFGDCDGDHRAFLAQVAQLAEAGLRRIFSHCEGFDTGADLLAWLLAHDRPVSASYVNWIGRTVRQIREEEALHRFLTANISRQPMASMIEARKLRRDLIGLVRAEQSEGRLQLTDEPPTPIAWQISKLVDFFRGLLLATLALPFLILLAPVWIGLLRRHEKNDPEVCPRPTVDFLLTLKRLEDHDITNQYTAFGLVKPGSFRRWLLTVILMLIDWAARHIFKRGFLARVQTIHFARWVFLDDKTRVMFASNYDGGHEAYMDDFINKVAWGLNLVFSNGVGWPRTDWLLKRGARIEQRFKHYQRRHQLPTQVWFKAYPGLALVDLRRNGQIRAGLSADPMTDEQVLDWLRLI